MTGPVHDPVADEHQIAWAAGLFEGEGSFSWATTDGRKYPQVHLATTDKDVLRHFLFVVRVGKIYQVKQDSGSRQPHYKPLEMWGAHGFKNVKIVGAMFRPYLGERRLAKLDELLLWKPLRFPDVDFCQEPVSPSLAGAMRHHNKGENLCDRCRLSRNWYMRDYQRAARAARAKQEFESDFDGAYYRRRTRAKLTREQVLEIRARYKGDHRGEGGEIARDYDVTATCIRSIVLRKTWKDV